MSVGPIVLDSLWASVLGAYTAAVDATTTPTTEAASAAAFEHALGPVDVDPDRPLGIPVARRNEVQRSEVNHHLRIGPLHHACERLGVADVDFDDRKRFGKAVPDVLRTAERKVVDDRDVMAGSREAEAHVRADVTAPACDQHVHGRRPSRLPSIPGMPINDRAGRLLASRGGMAP